MTGLAIFFAVLFLLVLIIINGNISRLATQLTLWNAAHLTQAPEEET